MKMNRTMSRMFVVTIAAVCTIALLAAPVRAQNAPPNQPAAVTPMPEVKPPPLLGAGKGLVTLTWDEFVQITGYDPTKGKQTLTIPLTEVEALMGVQLKELAPGMSRSSVDLPWTEFRALLEWSVKKKGEAETPPPTDFIVTASRYEATLSPDKADVTMTFSLNVLRKNGWKRIAVLPSNVAMTESKLPEGVFININNNVYELLTEKSGPIADITLKFSVLVNKSSGISSVAFGGMLASSSVLDLTFTEAAEPKVAGAQSLVVKTDEGKTKAAAAIPAGQQIAISWERFVPKPPAAPTKLYAETQTLVAVGEGILACQESVDFNILHSPADKLKLTVPKGVNVLEVVGRNIQDWRVDEKGELTVQVRGDAIGAYNLRISYEYPITGTPVIPVIQPVGVEREKGYVGVIALSNVEITAGKVETATNIDVKDLSAGIVSMTNQPILLAFRYVGQKFSIPLIIKKHGEVSVLVTVVDSAVFTTMQLDDGRRMTRAIYTVRNNRNQFLRVTLPTGAQLWSAAVSGNTVTPGSDEKDNLLIPLIRSAANAAELASFPVELVYVETPEKAAPTAGKLRVTVPKLDQPTMHVMVNYYAPAEGKYGKAGGLFSAATSGFSGSLRLTDNFAAMVTDNKAVVQQDSQKVAQQMQKQFENKTEIEAKAAGVTPIRVRLPIEGKLFKLEKILALQGDDLFFDVEYSDWKPAN